MLQPGDILCVRGASLVDEAIRAAAAMRDQPNMDNHVAVFHHWDAGGTPWGIEGRPGGVGWVDVREYIDNPFTINNAGQPKSEQARDTVCDYVKHLLGTPYDWEAIGEDAMFAIRAAWLWRRDDTGTVPGHVVCSSLAAYAYDRAHLSHPVKPNRTTTPADWVDFIITNRFNVQDV